MINVGWSEFGTALIALALLVTALRWVFDGDRGSRPRKVRIDGKFGLLTRATLVPDVETAQAVVGELHRDGLRATLAERDDGDVEILVFTDDLRRARSAIGAFARGDRVSGPAGRRH